MTPRLTFEQLNGAQPALARALLSLGEAAAGRLEPALIHLVKLRASQLNGCGYCQHMHAHEARQDGERQGRLDVLAAWQELPGFTPRERAALRWAEALTLLCDGPVPDEAYAALQAEFSLEEIADLTALVVTINGWNRVATAVRFVPAD